MALTAVQAAFLESHHSAAMITIGRPAGPLSWFGGELGETAFLQAMVDEGRLIYEFEIHRGYGTF